MIDRPDESARDFTRIETNEALALLANDRRRRLLLELAERESDDDFQVELDDAETDAAVELYHNHLPRLADAGVIAWDPDEGVVKRGGAFADIRPFVERLDEYSDELPGDWRAAHHQTDDRP
ncbi:DUF7344 domain-containing protein [Halorubrum trueperi]|uniref:ArsR family transcriptional regulator n=1 Tax=Halorubrum trueperi TaxID=2004704 RepID=A0ABD5UJG7_9EURY